MMTPNVREQTWWVIGLARSGCAAGALLRRHGARAIGLDDADEAAVGRRWESEGLSNLAPRAFDEIHTGGRTPSSSPDRSPDRLPDAVVISPGVPTNIPRLRDLPPDIPVLGELELGARFCAARQVAVTGTNGKTTTTEWLAHLGRTAGLQSVALGNVGRPLCAVADELAADALAVIEVSSFQLETISDFRPEAGLLLNLAPDHLDRYPDLDAYFDAKRNLARAIPAEGTFVTWTGCGPALDWDVAARQLLFGDESAGADVFLRQGDLVGRFDGEEGILLAESGISLQSAPNLLNAQACAAAGLALGLPREAIARGLGDFPGLPHRHEVVAGRGGVRFVNDTKATNVHAVCAGLEGYRRPVVLIVGGSGKGEDYAPLRAVMQSVRHVVLLGQEGPAIGAVLDGVVPTSRAVTMEEALEQAVAAAEACGEKETDVLLSPACASFDLFPNYRRRGEAFRKAALALGAEPTERAGGEG